MPKPREFQPISLDTPADCGVATVSGQASTTKPARPTSTAKAKRGPKAKLKPVAEAHDKALSLATHAATQADFEQSAKVPLDKHVGKLKHKVAFSAHKIADELGVALSVDGQKDSNYIKGLVWSLGVLFDKLSGEQGATVNVSIPAKLLNNIRSVIEVQVKGRAEDAASRVIDVTPASEPTLDYMSREQVDKSTA